MGAVTARPDGSRPRLAALGLASLPVIGVLVFAIAMLVGTRPEHVPILIVAIGSGLLCAIPLLLDQARAPADRHILITMLSMSWVLFFVLPVFTRYFLGGGYTPEEMTTIRSVLPRDLLRGQLVVLLAYLCMITGYASPFGPILTKALPPPRRDWSLSTGLQVAIVMIPLGWAIYLGSQFGLVPKRAGSGVLGAIAASTIFGIALLVLLYLRFRSRVAYLMLFVTIPPTMAFNFFTGSKGLFFAPLAMIPLTYVVVRRRFKIRWAIAALIAFSLFYPVAQFYREVVLERNTKKAADILRDPQAALRRVSAFATAFEFQELATTGLAMTSARFTGLGIASKIIRDTPERVPYQGGWSIGYVFLSYVPRVLWPGKPDITIGQWVTDHYMAAGIRSQTGPTWTGELYFNFGLLGVIVGMFILGLYFRMLRETVFRADAPVPAAWLSVIFIYQLVPGLGSGLVSPINGLGFFGGLILMIHLVARGLGGTVRIGPADGQPSGAVASSGAGS